MNLSELIHTKRWSIIPERIALHPLEVHDFCDGNLPIHLACRNTNVPVHVIEDLIEDYPESLTIGSSSFGQLPLHCALCTRFPNANVKVIKVLLKHYKKGASVHSSYGHLPLYDYLLTSYEPSFDIIQLLVEAYPDAVTVHDETCTKQFYPLHCAAIRSNCDIVDYLIQVYPDGLLKKTGDGRTAQDIAHRYRNVDVEKLLREETKKRFMGGKESNGKDDSASYTDENTIQHPNENNDNVVEEPIFLDDGNMGESIDRKQREERNENNNVDVVKDLLNSNYGTEDENSYVKGTGEKKKSNNDNMVEVNIDKNLVWGEIEGKNESNNDNKVKEHPKLGDANTGEKTGHQKGNDQSDNVIGVSVQKLRLSYENNNKTVI